MHPPVFVHQRVIARENKMLPTHGISAKKNRVEHSQENETTSIHRELRLAPSVIKCSRPETLRDTQVRPYSTR
jgi:hypothetical protein